MLFMRDGIPSKFLNTDIFISRILNLLVEINLRSKRWLLSGSYNPYLNSIHNHLVQLRRKFDFYSSKYERFVVLGNFNGEMTNTHQEEFCSVYNFKSLIKDPACFKNPAKPTTVNHILTNHLRCFQHSDVSETGLFDFHRFTLTVLKGYHSTQNPKTIQYRDYKNFTNELFRETFYGSYLFKTRTPTRLLNKLRKFNCPEN